MANSCSMEAVCFNSPIYRGEDGAKCALCRLSPDNLGREMMHYWQPTLVARANRTKHPTLEAEKREAKVRKHFAKLSAKRSRDPMKRKISRLATQAEKITEKKIIHATKNSGRRNKDGDHVYYGDITLDTKLQTTRENPIILLAELEKVRADASRAGKLIGGLVIRNKHNVGCVVLTEADFAVLIRRFSNE